MKNIFVQKIPGEPENEFSPGTQGTVTRVEFENGRGTVTVNGVVGYFNYDLTSEEAVKAEYRAKGFTEVP